MTSENPYAAEKTVSPTVVSEVPAPAQDDEADLARMGYKQELKYVSFSARKGRGAERTRVALQPRFEFVAGESLGLALVDGRA